MNIDQAYPSKYFKGADFQAGPRQFRIRDCVMELMESRSDGNSQHKPVLYFDNEEKGYVLGINNAQTIRMTWGPDTDQWRGQIIELFFDSSIMFGRERTGGVRVRPVVAQQQVVGQQQAPPLGYQQPVGQTAGTPQQTGVVLPNQAQQPDMRTEEDFDRDIPF